MDEAMQCCADLLEQADELGMHPLALFHKQQGKGGHWWRQYDEDMPEYWPYCGGSPSVCTDDAPQRCTQVETPDVPDDVDFSDYAYYACDGCGWPCINREDSEAYAEGICWNCLRNDDPLPDGNEITR